MNKKITSFLTLCMYAPFVFCADQDKDALLKKEAHSICANTGPTNIPAEVLSIMQSVDNNFNPAFRQKIFDNEGGLIEGHEKLINNYGNRSNIMMCKWLTAGLTTTFGSLFSGLTAIGMVDSFDEQEQANSATLLGLSAVQLLLTGAIVTQAVPYYYEEKVKTKDLLIQINKLKNKNLFPTSKKKEQNKQD